MRCRLVWLSYVAEKYLSYADGAFAQSILSHDHLPRGTTVATISVRCGNSGIMISTCLDLALLCHPVLAFLSIQRPKMAAQQSKWQYFFLSFFALLAMRYASTTAATPQAPQEIVQPVCQSVDQPNPIASIYPLSATGTLNGTVSNMHTDISFLRFLKECIQLYSRQYMITKYKLSGTRYPIFRYEMPLNLDRKHANDD